jgi:hypothetical protein
LTVSIVYHHFSQMSMLLGKIFFYFFSQKPLDKLLEL